MCTDIDDPLNDLPVEVRDALEEAGWKPGHSRAEMTRGPFSVKLGGWPNYVSYFWDESLELGVQSSTGDLLMRSRHAQRVLDELAGLRLMPLVGEVLRSQIVFDVTEGIAMSDEIKKLSVFLQSLLIPIGEVLSESIILLGESGSVFLLGYVGYGVLYVDYSFGPSMKKLLIGEALTPLDF